MFISVQIFEARQQNKAAQSASAALRAHVHVRAEEDGTDECVNIHSHVYLCVPGAGLFTVTWRWAIAAHSTVKPDTWECSTTRWRHLFVFITIKCKSDQGQVPEITFLAISLIRELKVMYHPRPGCCWLPLLPGCPITQLIHISSATAGRHSGGIKADRTGLLYDAPGHTRTHKGPLLHLGR